jgi:hypothetical protein
MGRVGAPVAVEVALGIAPARVRRRRVVPAVFRLEALHARPGLDQRAINTEVRVQEQRFDLRLAQHRLEELGRDVAAEKTIAIFREHRHVPDGIIHAEAREPAKQQVIVQLFHQLAFRADRIEGLEQKRPEQLLGRDRRPADRRVEHGKVSREVAQRGVHERQDAAKGVVQGHTRLAAHIAEQRLASNVVAPHSQTQIWWPARCHLPDPDPCGDFFRNLLGAASDQARSPMAIVVPDEAALTQWRRAIFSR